MFDKQQIVNLDHQFLLLNNSYSLEPRAGLKYQIGSKSTLSLGYGKHSQMQTPDVYFYKAQKPDGTYDDSNKNLGFTNSQHFVMGYDILPIKDWRIKTEVYYQFLSNVPVTISPSSFSMLNNGASFLPNSQGFLENKGTGTNYGIELTIEKFFSQGYYALLTGSLYESKYKGSDNIERNTAFNGKFVYNVLGGKDIKIGTEKRNTLNIGFKMTQAGGRYYTPVNLIASQRAHTQVLEGDSYAYIARIPDFFRLDIKIGYTQNGKKLKIAQSWAFDVQNVTNHKNVFAQQYNPVNNQVNTVYQIGFFPNFIYKIQF